MNHLSRAAAVLVSALALWGGPVHAEDSFRVGFVNPDRVLREALPAKAAQAKLESEFTKRDKDLQAQGEALKAASERFEREAPTLSEAQRAQRQRALIDQDREFQRKRREALPAKAAQAKLESEFTKRDKDLQAQGEALKAASERFEREAPTLSEAQRAQRQRALIDQDREFQRKRREFQEDLNARKNEELQAVYERANRAIKQIAESDRYDAILQEAIYINPKHDITDKVIRALNASGSGGDSAPGASR